MSVKQIRWHAAILAVIIFVAITVLFALATVTSNAAEVKKEKDDQGNWTYIMDDSTYDEQIVLAENTTTTIKISGENKLTHGKDFTDPCIKGNGNLTIIGDGTLDVSGGQISCEDFTMNGGAKLKIAPNNTVCVDGTVKVNNADIVTEFGRAWMYCGLSDHEEEHVFNNAGIDIELYLYGDTVLTDCNIIMENRSLISESGELTIDGGTYEITQNFSENLFPSPAMSVEDKAKINNAVIITNSPCRIRNLEMTDSELDITVPYEPEVSSYCSPYALVGDNLVISGSKVNIDGGSAVAGILASDQLIITGKTVSNVKSTKYGIAGKNVKITNSSGTFQATDPDRSIAAVAAYESASGTSTVKPGTITLNAVDVKKPTGGIVDKLTVQESPTSASQMTITTIADVNTPAKLVVLEANHTTHVWDTGKVTKEPTTSEDGIKTYTCEICGETKTEAIPKLSSQDSQGSQDSKDSKGSAKGEDGTVFGKGASVEAAEAAILALPNDNDPTGTAFGLLQLKATKVTKNSIKLNWKAVPGATKYIIFANKCGTGNKYKKLDEVTGTSFTATQAAGAALKKGTYYKFMMIAADANGKVVSTSKTVHAATKGGKVGNHKKVTVKKSVTKKAKKLKKGKTLKLKAKAVPQAKKLKVRKHRGIKYESSNPAVAQVNGKGAVKGVNKGTCYIYAYAQNGTCAKVKVTVK